MTAPHLILTELGNKIAISKKKYCNINFFYISSSWKNYDFSSYYHGGNTTLKLKVVFVVKNANVKKNLGVNIFLTLT